MFGKRKERYKFIDKHSILCSKKSIAYWERISFLYNSNSIWDIDGFDRFIAFEEKHASQMNIVVT